MGEKMKWLSGLWNNFCNSGPVKVVRNIYNGFFGKDTPDFYTRKDLVNKIIPAGTIIVFRSKNDWFASAIRKVTEKWANHIGVVTHTDVNGIIHTVEAEANGIVADNLNRAFNTNSQLILIYKDNLTALQATMLVEYLNGKIGERYGYDELFNFILNTDYNDQAADFCSELAVNAYAQIGIKISNKDPQSTAPGDILIYVLNPTGPVENLFIFDSYNILIDDVKKLTE